MSKEKISRRLRIIGTNEEFAFYSAKQLDGEIVDEIQLVVVADVTDREEMETLIEALQIAKYALPE